VLAVLYGVCGLTLLITAGAAVVMVPMFIIEWNQDSEPINLFRIAWAAMWCIGGMFSFMLGVSCIRLARLIFAQ
jgi:hypothetical protein